VGGTFQGSTVSGTTFTAQALTGSCITGTLTASSTAAATMGALFTTNQTAATALSTAQTAQGSAATALSTAQTAQGSAATALSTAQTAQGSAATALSTAQAAQTAAAQAAAQGSAAQTAAAQASAQAATKLPLAGGTLSAALAVQGTITATQTISSQTGDVIAFASDDRLKNRIVNIQGALGKVSNLNGFLYTFNDIGRSFGFDGEQHVGVSAQEIQKVLPEVIKPAPFDLEFKTGNNYMTVQYDKVVPLLIEAIKEETTKRQELEERIKQLEKLLSTN
jgi:hypothetical protein